MRSKTRNISLALFFLFLLVPGISAAETIVYSGSRLLIGDRVDVFTDTSNKLTAEEVFKAGTFTRSKQQTPNFDISTNTYWIRFSIKNEAEVKRLFLEVDYPLIDSCALYIIKDGKPVLSRLEGSDLPFSSRRFKSPSLLFYLDPSGDSETVYLLKVRSTEQLVVPLIIGDYQTISENQSTKDVLSGIHVGILLVMLFYNFFLYMSIRDRSYLYYVLYILFIGLTQTTLTGYTYKYLYPNSPGFFNLSIVLYPGLAGVAAIAFIRSMLHTKAHTPVLNKIIGGIMFLYSCAVLTRLLGMDQVSSRLVDISGLLGVVFVFIIAFRISLRKKYRPARFFLIAWSIFMVGLILFILRNLNVLPYNNFTNFTMQAGTAIEVTLLSIALADKINILEREKRDSQEDALRVAMENERIIREQNVILEVKVKERTHELEESNDNLNRTLDELKQAQTQLVESEKMASLGQLTAGIAHEINNPINFVTSNVKPLKRDVQILMDVLKEVEHYAYTDLTGEEKKKKIAELKSSQDFDYLTTEIDYLLKGIQEGSSRTAEIVKGLRIFSRVDEDDIKMADINEGIDSTLVIANNLMSNKIKVEKHYDSLPLVECYPGKLNQVFLNMVTNAIYAINAKFREDEGGLLTIRTRLVNNQVYIHFQDNGMGMDEVTSRKLFEPFFTTKPVGEGTGLGLSIAYNTIKKHNGSIMVKSEPGTGTEFIIEIPSSQPVHQKEA